MRFPAVTPLISVLLLGYVRAESSQPGTSQTIHVKHQAASQPFSYAGGSPLASINYNVSSLEGRVTSYTPPTGGETALSPQTSHPLFRIYPDTPDTSTTVTSLATFDRAQRQILTLHLNDDHFIFAASVFAEAFSTDPLPSDPPESRLKVVLMPPKTGPSPKLVPKKPVVIDAGGKEVPEVAEVEKSILQKYWWVFALVAVIALTSGGDK